MPNWFTLLLEVLSGLLVTGFVALVFFTMYMERKNRCERSSRRR